MTSDKAGQIRTKNLKSRYGITPEDYDRMLEEQHGGCAICGTQENTTHGSLVVDHCHFTGKVRGLLCNDCNVGIGRFNDIPEKLEAAIDYLKRH